MEKIVGKKVILRPISEDDTDNIVKWRNTSFVRDNFIYRAEFTPSIHENWLKTKVFTGEVVQYIICDSEMNPFGSVFYRDIDNFRKTAEFGIFIGDINYINKGYGKEVTSLFLDFGFEELGFNCIKLRVLKNNSRAISVYEKSGFKVVSEEKEISYPSNEMVDVVMMEAKRK